MSADEKWVFEENGLSSFVIMTKRRRDTQDVTAGDNASIYTSLQMKNAWEEGGEGDDREEVGMIEWRSG